MLEQDDLKAVRNCFNLTQVELAIWLGVSRVRLAQAESVPRPLPRQAAARLRPLVLAMLPTDAPLPETPALPPYLGPLPARLAECRYQAQRLGWLLRDMQAQANAMQQRRSALPLLLATLPADPAHDLRHRWLLRLFDGEAQDKLMAEVGPMPQALLSARIAGYEREAEVLVQYEG